MRAGAKSTRKGGRNDEVERVSKVVVTGICGRLGKRVTRMLHRAYSVEGIDRRPFPERPKDVIHHQIDIRRKKCRDVFRHGDVAAVVHLGIMHDPRASTEDRHTWNVDGFAKLLEYLDQYHVPKLVVLSSANVYGPRPGNPQFLTEEAPLMGGQNFPEIRDLIEVDMLAQSYFWRKPETETVILRPVHILGSVKNAPSNYLRREWVPTLMGFDPMVQVIHEDDVVGAIVRALTPGVRGIFNLTGPGEIPLSRALDILHKPSVPLPASVITRVQKRLWRWRLTAFPAPEYDHIRFVCMVDGRRAREVLGFAPAHGLRDTLEAVQDL
ncbi:MAG: NAD-dependent epimerase/dehydratase family protein [Deltaproteobacteria bacterium]|nr:NAD-dependent epimerase/dehydratase family protein [Deltaproteobacteria bacterium]